jgi:hypothetical protein
MPSCPFVSKSNSESTRRTAGSNHALVSMVMASHLQVEAQRANGQETKCADRHAAHDVHALRGVALQQGDVIADLRAQLRCNGVRSDAQHWTNKMMCKVSCWITLPALGREVHTTDLSLVPMS